MTNFMFLSSFSLFLLLFFLIHVIGKFNQLDLSLYMSPESKSSSAAFSRHVILPDQAVVVSEICFFSLRDNPSLASFTTVFVPLAFILKQYGFFSSLVKALYFGFVKACENSRYMLVMTFNHRFVVLELCCFCHFQLNPLTQLFHR